MSLGQWNLRQMCHSAILVPSKPKGDWKSNLHTYVTFRKWSPSVDLHALNEHEAKEKVILHYLSGFGPAMIEDIAWWIGITKGEVKEILEEMGDKVEDKNRLKITLSFFEKTNKPLLKVIEQQAEKLAHFMGGKEFEIILHEPIGLSLSPPDNRS